MTSIFKLLLVQLALGRGILFGKLDVSPATVHEQGVYTFEVDLARQIPANGYIFLTFEKGMDLEERFGLGGKVPCAATYGFQEANDIRCEVVTATQAKIYNAFPSKDYLLIFTISGLQNPGYVDTFKTQLSSYTQDNQLIDVSGSSTFKFSSNAGSMKTTILNLGNSKQVAGYTNIQVEITPQHEVPAGGRFELELPKWNAGTQSLGMEQSMFRVDESTFDRNSYSYHIACNSTDHPNLVCLFLEVMPHSADSIPTTFDKLTIRGFEHDLPKDEMFQFKTTDTSFRNPPSTRPVKTFQAHSYDGNGNLQDQQVRNIQYSVSEPLTVSASNIQMSAASGEINDQNQFDFTINMPLPLPVGATISMRIPPQLRIFSDAARTERMLTSAYAYQPLYSVPQVRIIDPVKQDIIVTGLVPSKKYYVDQDNPIKFSLLDLMNPSSVEETDPFELEVYDQEYLILKVENHMLTYKAEPGRLREVTVTVENYRTREKLPYSFSFVTKNKFANDGQILIKVPKMISVDEASLSIKPVAILSRNQIKLSYNNETREITIVQEQEHSQHHETSVAKSSTQKVQFILEGLQNAPSTKPTEPFVISTMSAAGKAIDRGESSPMHFTANVIKAIETEACAPSKTNSRRTSQTDEICTYRLKFIIGAEYPIESDSQLRILLPDDLDFGDDVAVETHSFTDGIADTSARFELVDKKKKGRRNEVKVLGAFLLKSSPNQKDWRKDSFSVSIAGIRSPRTTAPTLSFKAYILGHDGYVQFRKEQGVYSNVNQAKLFTKSVIKRSNEINGDSTGHYNFTVQLASEVKKGEFIKVTPPEAINIRPGGDQCKGFEPLAEQLSCVLKDRSLFVMLIPKNPEKAIYNVGEVISFQVQRIKNPISLEPTNSFKLYASTSLQRDYKINQMDNGLSLLNTIEGNLSKVKVLPDSNMLGSRTAYSIYFTTENVVQRNSYIEVEFPKDYFSDLTTVGCYGIKNVPTNLQCNVEKNLITLKNPFNNTQPSAGREIGFKLSGIHNPQESVPADVIAKDFRISTLTEGGYPVSRAHNLNFTIGCQFPCSACSVVQTKCTACRFLDEATPLFLHENQCMAQCPAGYSGNRTSYRCEACKYPCERCSTQSDFCDSCLQTSQTPFVQKQVGKCFKTCPDGWYKATRTLTCEKCSATCQTCTDKSECKKCKVGFKFYQGQCLSKCPTTSIEDTTTIEGKSIQECRMCKEPCFTCSNSTDNCQTCQKGKFLMGKQCKDRCDRTYTTNELNQCVHKPEQIRPFFSLIGTALIIIIVGISKCVSRKTRVFTSFLAYQSAYMVCFWFYMLIFELMDDHKAAATMVCCALICNYLMNCVWYNFYKERILGHDVLYTEYKRTYKSTQKCILVLSMLTSFQLFRLQYSQMWGADSHAARFAKRAKFYKRMNRYSLFQITFVYAVTIAASIYNLAWQNSWWGRQVFWIEIENLGVSVLMCITIFVTIQITQGKFVLDEIQRDRWLDEQHLRDKKKRKLYQVHTDAEVRSLAQEIDEFGGFNKTLAEKTKRLTANQQRGIWQSLFAKLFYRNRLVHPSQEGSLTGNAIKDKEHEYIVKHGRENERGTSRSPGKRSPKKKNKNDQSLLGRIRKINLRPYHSQKGTKPTAKTMVNGRKESYSSVNVETDQNQALNTAGNQLLLQTDQTNQQVTTLRKQSGEAYKVLQQETMQEDTLQDETPNLEDTGEHSLNLVMRKKSAQDQSECEETDPELINFASAPFNMDSAYRGNEQLQGRHAKLMAELDLKRAEIKEVEAMKKRELKKPKKGKQTPIFMSKDGKRKPVDSPRKLETSFQSITDFDPDSEDDYANWNSEKWGNGTSKVIASHYNNIQQSRYDPQKNMEYISDDDVVSRSRKSDGKKRIHYNKLSVGDFKTLGNDLAEARRQKNFSRQNHSMYANQRAKLEEQVDAEEKENVRLQAVLDDLKKEIGKQMRLLTEAEEKKRQELSFIENANFTSNEEAMGVSPNSYISANRMPNKPGSRVRSPIKEASQGAENSHGTANRIYTQAEGSTESPTKNLMPGLRVIKTRRSKGQNMADMDTSIRHKPGSRSKSGGSHSRGVRNTSKISGNRLVSTQQHWVPGGGPTNGSGNISGRNSNRNRSVTNMSQGTNMRGRSTQHVSNNFAKVVPYVSDSEHRRNSKKASESGRRNNLRGPSEHEEFEYYTSVDGLGNAVQKLRKKKKDGSRGPGKKRSAVMNQVASKEHTGMKRNNDLGGEITGQDDPRLNPRISKGQDGQFRNGQKRVNEKRNTSPGNENVSADELGYRKAHRKAQSQFKDDSRRVVVKQSSSVDRSRVQPLASSVQVDRRRDFSVPSKNIQAFEDQESRDNLTNSQQILGQVKGPIKVKRTRPKDFSGVYFNHTNFEKAVIATNGKAPYNNKEVEMISSRKGFEPNTFKFKDNWINKIDKNYVERTSNKQSPSPMSGSVMQRNNSTNQRNERAPSASQTATSVFTGQPPAMAGIQNSEYRGAPSYQGIESSPPAKASFPGVNQDIKLPELSQVSAQKSDFSITATPIALDKNAQEQSVQEPSMDKSEVAENQNEVSQVHSQILEEKIDEKAQ